METFIDKIDYEVKNWWLSLLLGLIYVGLALCLMFAPLNSYIVMAIVFSISILISGVFEIIFALSNRKGISSWGWYLTGGVIDLILGLYLIAFPLLSMEIIPFVVAFWLMFRGFTFAAYSMDLKRFGTSEWGWYMAFGILAILCALAIIWQPGVGAISIVYMLSFAFLILGFFRIMLSFEFKGIHKKNKELHK